MTPARPHSSAPASRRGALANPHPAPSLSAGPAFDRDTARRGVAPPGPPAPAPGPPPPPPPPPATTFGAPLSGGRWILGALVAVFAWWAIIAGQAPVALDGGDGLQYVKTAGGATVLLAEDSSGRPFLVDGAGDLYYDSGDPDVGWYIVDADNNVFNLFFEDGSPRRVRVGTLDALASVDATRLAGLPVASMRAAGAAAGARLTGFVADDGVPLPPNAPVSVAADGRPAGPPVLEEDVMLLEKKGGLLDGGNRKGDKLDTLAAAADAAAERAGE